VANQVKRVLLLSVAFFCLACSQPSGVDDENDATGRDAAADGTVVRDDSTDRSDTGSDSSNDTALTGDTDPDGNPDLVEDRSSDPVNDAVEDGEHEGDESIRDGELDRADSGDGNDVGPPSTPDCEDVWWTVHTLDYSFSVTDAVDSGDINGDSRDDLAGAGLDGFYFYTVESSSRYERIDLEAPNYPDGTAIALGQFDTGSSLDIVGADYDIVDDLATIYVWLNKSGDGVDLSAEVAHTFADQQVTGLFAGDIDDDGDVDIAFSTDAYLAIDEPGGVYWLENTDGSGENWTRHAIEEGLNDPSSVAIADLDGAGRPEIWATIEWDHEVVVYRWNGSSWGREAIATEFREPSAVIAADLDHDGHQDVLATSFDSGELRWWRNDGSGGLPGVGEVLATRFSGANSIDVADVDGDGDRDVVVSGYYQSRLLLALNGGNATEWTRREMVITDYISTSPIQKPESVRFGDFDGDGDTDIGVGLSHHSYHHVRWARNNALVDAVEFSEHVVDYYSPDLESLALGDIDGDDDIDFVTGSTRTETISWWRNAGTGGFAEIEVDTEYSELQTVALGDLDGDDDIDIVAGSLLGEGVTIFENRDGAGNNWVEVAVSDESAADLHVVDIDGDDDLDILAAGLLANRIVLWENDDDGGWDEVEVDSDFEMAMSVASGDLDDDGDLDIVAGSGGEDGVRWWEQTESDGWVAHGLSGISAGATVVVADVDGDEDDDVIMSSFTSRGTWARLQGDDGEFTSVRLEEFGDGARGLATADVDGDGDLDVLVAAEESDRVYYIEQLNGGKWYSHRISFGGALQVGAADLNGDGSVEVIAVGDDIDGDFLYWDQLCE